MNRIKLPPPPSSRPNRGGSADWKGKLHEVVRQAIGYAARHGTLDQALMKQVLIRAGRLALSDLTNAELADDYEAAVEGERDVEEITLAIRHTVQHQVPHPIDSLMLETIMAEIQRAMDDEFARALDVAVRMIASKHWLTMGQPPRGRRDEVVARVVREARESLGCDLDGEHRRDHPEHGTLLTSVGLLRSMLGGFVLSSPDRVRSLLKSIERSAGLEMARAVPGSTD